MEMAYRERWRTETAELKKILAGFDLSEERKWGKPCYTLNGKNVVIIQGFKEHCALMFFQGALLKDWPGPDFVETESGCTAFVLGRRQIAKG